MKQIYKIPESIYGDESVLFIGSPQRLKSYLLKHYKYNDISPEEYTGKAAQVIFLIHERDGHACNIVWMPSFAFLTENYSSLAHECVHIAMRRLSDVGIKIERDNDEALAYLVDFYFYKFLSELTEEYYKNEKQKGRKKKTKKVEKN